MDRIELSSVIIGDNITEGVYCLKSVQKGNDKYLVVLKDKSGELNCELAPERYEKGIDSLVGGPVLASFVVVNGLNTTPLGIIKSLKKAEDGSYNPSDVLDGLNDEVIARYKSTIKDCMKNITDKGLSKLVASVLDEQTLSQLASMPATLAYHGRYRGGALATTATVTKMVIQSGFQYIKAKNGLYEPKLDWNILITASLLANVGVIDYLSNEPPFLMTPVGLERGYMSVLQHRIEKVADTIPEISEFTLARILNILACSIPMKSGVKATSQEGVVLRHCQLLYEELDMLDYEMANHEAEDGEGYFYNSKLRRNIYLPNGEEEKAS